MVKICVVQQQKGARDARAAVHSPAKERTFSTSLPLPSRPRALRSLSPLPRTTLHQILSLNHPAHMVPQHHPFTETIQSDHQLVSFLAFFTAPTMFKLISGLWTTIRIYTRQMMPTLALH